jgi:hypothetical protein
MCMRIKYVWFFDPGIVPAFDNLIRPLVVIDGGRQLTFNEK